MHGSSKLRRLLAMGAGVSLAVAGLGAGVAQAAAPRVPVPGGAPSWVGATPSLGAAAATGSVSVRVYLAPKGGEAALQAAVEAVSTPGSPSYRHFITPAQYRATYKPTGHAVKRVEAWLTSSGLTVTGVEKAHRYVAAAGTVQAAQTAFGTSLGTFQHEGQTVQAATGQVTVPAAVGSDVLAVVGLNPATKMQPAWHGPYPPPPAFNNARPCSIFYGQILAKFQADFTTPLPKFMGQYRDYAPCGYTPIQFRTAYERGTSLDGSGVTVAITDAYAAPTILHDANMYSRRQGDPAFRPGQFKQVLPSSFNRANICGPSGWFGEETLDVEAVHGMALGANVRYYGSASCFDNDFLDTLAKVVDQNKASIVSNSWGDVEEAETTESIVAYEQVFQQGALQGIGFMFSSGDNGDESFNTGIVQADYPTSDPYVTSVGGTSTAIGPSGELDWQTGWGTWKYTLSSDGHSWEPIAPIPFLYGAGGGFSHLFNRPSYQRGVVLSGTPGRAVPDVAMDADPTTGMLVGETQQFPYGIHYGEFRLGGTSLASPLMAGFQALASENAGSRLGFANPMIYQLARSGAGAFDDVTSVHHGDGNVRPDYVNGVGPRDGIVYSVRTFDQDTSLHTGPGWDDVTGVGVPNPTYLARAH